MCGVSSFCTSFHHSAAMLETEWPLMDSQAPGMGRARGSGKAACSQWTVATWHAGLAPAEITVESRLPPCTRHAPHTVGPGCGGAAGGGIAVACLGRLWVCEHVLWQPRCLYRQGPAADGFALRLEIHVTDGQ